MLNMTDLNTTVGEFQRDYIYKLIVNSYPALINAGFSAAKTVADAMDLYGEKGLFPESKHQAIKVLWGGEYGYWSGPVDNAGTGVLDFKLDADWNVYKFWKEWKKLGANDVNGASYPKPLTVGELSIYMVALDKESIKKGCLLKNVMVNDIKEIKANKTSKDIVRVQVGITWDRRFDLEGGGTV